MKNKIAICFLSVFLTAFSVLGQCDTSFYNFKREIISSISMNVDSMHLFNISNEDLFLEFSDYREYSYVIGDGHGPVGFLFFRDSICNNYQDSVCIRKNARQQNFDLLLFDKSKFETYMATDDGTFCNRMTNHTHIYSKLIEEPVEHWAMLEQYYFKQRNHYNLSEPSLKGSILLTIPLYIYKDKKMQTAFLFRVEISGVKKENIKIVEPIKTFPPLTVACLPS